MVKELTDFPFLSRFTARTLFNPDFNDKWIFYKKKGHPIIIRWHTPFSRSEYSELNYADINSSRSFLALLYVKCNLIAFT